MSEWPTCHPPACESEFKPVDDYLYACPNCNGSGSMPTTMAFAGICTWCFGARRLTSGEIKAKGG
jgi:hypothetical protein